MESDVFLNFYDIVDKIDEQFEYDFPNKHVDDSLITDEGTWEELMIRYDHDLCHLDDLDDRMPPSDNRGLLDKIYEYDDPRVHHDYRTRTDHRRLDEYGQPLYCPVYVQVIIEFNKDKLKNIKKSVFKKEFLDIYEVLERVDKELKYDYVDQNIRDDSLIEIDTWERYAKIYIGFSGNEALDFDKTGKIHTSESGTEKYDNHLFQLRKRKKYKDNVFIIGEGKNKLYHRYFVEEVIAFKKEKLEKHFNTTDKAVWYYSPNDSMKNLARFFGGSFKPLPPIRMSRIEAKNRDYYSLHGQQITDEQISKSYDTLLDDIIKITIDKEKVMEDAIRSLIDPLYVDYSSYIKNDIIEIKKNKDK